MKKFFAIIMTICLLATTLCITAFAAEAPAAGVVVRVSGLKEDDTVYYPENCDYKNFAEGWEAAVDYACDEDFMEGNDILRIVVDFYADWNANASGEFGKSSWTGFQYSTIYVPSDTRITINLNGHTINRGLKEYEYDGEVICINDDADVIINGGKSGDPIIEPGKDAGDVKTGAITGGFSCNGAGGIHMQDGSKLTLNNVNIIGNKVEDDDGAGIAVYDNATLTMNGGSISNNNCFNWADNMNGGCGVYVNDSKAVFNHTVFQNNQFKKYYRGKGAAIYADDSDVTINNCKVIGNGKSAKSKELVGSDAVIYGTGGRISINDTAFEENGYPARDSAKESSLIYSKCDLSIDKCVFTKNHTVYIIDTEGYHLDVSNTDFKDNDANVFYGYGKRDIISFANCNFNNNVSSSANEDVYTFNFTGSGTVFYDCDMGDSTMNDEKYAKYTDSPIYADLPSTQNGNRLGSIFGEGSLPMIVSLIALIASVVSICITLVVNKKKSTSAAKTKTTETENEDEE